MRGFPARGWIQNIRTEPGVYSPRPSQQPVRWVTARSTVLSLPRPISIRDCDWLRDWVAASARWHSCHGKKLCKTCRSSHRKPANRASEPLSPALKIKSRLQAVPAETADRGGSHLDDIGRSSNVAPSPAHSDQTGVFVIPPLLRHLLRPVSQPELREYSKG